MSHLSFSSGRVFLTGATGQVGRRVLLELVRQRRPVTVMLRRPQAQLPALLSWLAEQGVSQPDVQAVMGDLLAPRLGWTPVAGSEEAVPAWASDIVAVVHAAAVWGWRLDPHQAEQANVQASLDLWHQSAQWPQMRRFVMVVGYMSQHRAHMAELGLDLTQRPAAQNVDWARVVRLSGAYEASKLRAYWLMREESLKLNRPLTVIHPATVMGDEASPEVPATSAIGQLLAQLTAGQMPLVPGSREHRVPLVSVGYVARYVAALIEAPKEGVFDEHLLLDPATPDLLSVTRVLAKGLQVRAPWGRVPLPWIRAVSTWPVVARVLGLEPESLGFIVKGAFDVSRETRWAQGRGLSHPDWMQSLSHTAAAWRRIGAAA